LRFSPFAWSPAAPIRVLTIGNSFSVPMTHWLPLVAKSAGIEIEMKHKQGGAPYSMDANMLHISYEGRYLENPNAEPEDSMWRWTCRR